MPRTPRASQLAPHRSFPRCEARRLIVATAGGPRVALGALFASFAQRERLAWDRWADAAATSDEHGIDAATVERFFTGRATHVQRELPILTSDL